MVKTTTNPLVSIIIPTYNAEKYIEETLISAINQTYKYIEIVIVDDGSSDNTLSIVQILSDVYPQIKCFSQKNQGAGKTRNRGIAESKGDYIMFLDQDDCLSSDKVEAQIDMLITEPLSTIVFCRFKRFYTNPEKDSISINIYQSIFKSYTVPQQLLIDMWSGKGFIQTSCWMCHRSMINKYGHWDVRLHKNDDGNFFCRVILNADKILFDDKSLVYYRSNVAGLGSSLFTREAQMSSLQSYLNYHDYIRDINNPELYVALANRFFRYIPYTLKYRDLCRIAENKIKELNVRCHFDNRFLDSMVPIVGYYWTWQTRRVFKYIKHKFKLTKWHV